MIQEVKSMKLMSWMLLVVALLAVGLAVGLAATALTASQGPSQVPVYYEPVPIRMQEPVAPDKADFTRPVTKLHQEVLPVWSGVPGQFYGVKLPEGVLLPFPDQPRGGVYESALTPTMVASREKQTGAWRYDSACYDFHRWDGVGTIPEVSCADLRAYLASDPDGDGYWTPARIDREIALVKRSTSSRVVDSAGENPADIPSYSCDRGKRYDPVRLCQLHPTATRAELEDNGAPEGEIDTLVAFVGTYAITETVTVIDWQKVQEQERQYRSDRDRIIAHNDQVRADNRYTAQECDAACESDYARAVAAYEAERATYDSGAVLNQGDIDAYLQRKVDAGRDMFVDCRQSGCVLVNPVR